MVNIFVLKHMYYNNNSAYSELNVSCIYKLHFINILLSFYRFKHNLVRVNNSCNTRYKENINICVPFFKKQLSMNSPIRSYSNIVDN